VPKEQKSIIEKKTNILNDIFFNYNQLPQI
jgi:hypothetical protein